jgi:hypothetical protein
MLGHAEMHAGIDIRASSPITQCEQKSATSVALTTRTPLKITELRDYGFREIIAEPP